MLFALVTICLSASPPNCHADSLPREGDCRVAITEALTLLRRTPPDIKERDQQDRKRLLAELERLVETNRRLGVSECQTWSQLMGKAFNQ
jgi:hypothetical protein